MAIGVGVLVLLLMVSGSVLAVRPTVQPAPTVEPARAETIAYATRFVAAVQTIAVEIKATQTP